MTPRIVLQPKVSSDLAAIIDYLAEQNPEAANRFADSVPVTLDGLALMPEKGSPRRFRSKRLAGVRSWHVGGFRKYLIFYRLIEGGIEVLAIVHGARRLSTLLKDRA